MTNLLTPITDVIVREGGDYAALLTTARGIRA